MQLSKAKIRYSDGVNKYISNPGRASTYTEDFKGEYYNLPIKKLLPFKNQARKVFDNKSLKTLAETIKEHGIRQPLTVLPSEIESGYFEVVSGERRLRAAKLIGKEYVPCIIIHDKLKAEEISIIENIQRKDLHPIELMRAYQNLLKEGVCHSIRQIAEKVGVIKSAVVDILNLKALPEAVQEELLQQNIKNRNFLRKLCKANPELHKKMIEDFLNSKCSPAMSKKQVKKFPQKRNILNIVLEGEKLTIAVDRILWLTDQQKLDLERMLRDIL